MEINNGDHAHAQIYNHFPVHICCACARSISPNIWSPFYKKDKEIIESPSPAQVLSSVQGAQKITVQRPSQ